MSALHGCCGKSDLSGHASTHVFLQIDPNISMSAAAPEVDGGTLQMGQALVLIDFRIDANTEAVQLSAIVTPLYKGNDPTGVEVLPIPVDLPAGVAIDAVNANEIQGGDGIAPYLDPTPGAVPIPDLVDAPEGLFPGHPTVEVIYESSQSGHFSQDLTLAVAYQNDDPEKPQGEYSGYVVLFGGVVESLP